MRTLIILTVAILALTTLSGPAVSSSEVSDTLSVVKDDQTGVSNADITALLAEVTPSPGDAVMITRDDSFADALASGLLQRGGPLFAVPSDGPIPANVLAQIQAAAPTRAIILGGGAAVSSSVEDELAALSLDVTRLAGGSRLETAIAIAESESPDADTVMLARAFPSDTSGDPTQAFADTLAAGGVSARTGWPVLLTQTEELSAATAAYLTRSGATRVLVLGGTAAISQATFDQAIAIVGDGQRVSGPTRFDTAVELEKVDGAQSAQDASQVILIEGTGTNAFTGNSPSFAQEERTGPAAWAAGYASAHRAFVFDAPILLTAGGVVPESTAAFLAGGVGGDRAIAPLITCTMTGPACEQGRQAAGLPAAVVVTADPVEGDLAPGDAVSIGFSGYDGPATVDGTCVAVPGSTTDGTAVSVVAADPLPDATCQITVTGITLSDGSLQTETLTYNTVAATAAPRRAATEVATLAFGIGGICAVAFDSPSDTLFLIRCSVETVIYRFDSNGQPRTPATIPFPFTSTNDVDLDIISTPTSIQGASIPAGSLLMIDGETAEGLVVLDPATGNVLAGPVDPGPGTSVGVAWDPLQDQVVELSWDTDTITRLSATDASAVTTFPVPSPNTIEAFDVFFGDIEAACNGSLFVVTSQSNSILAMDGDGTRTIAFYDIERTSIEAAGFAGIALDDATGRAYIAHSGTGDVIVVDGLDTGVACP